MSLTKTDEYEYKYNKYKNKYIKLRREIEEKLQNTKKIKKTFETYDGYRIPYHEEYIENIPETLITKNPAKRSNKILVIDTVEAFDTFTKLYAKEVFDKKYMYVRWERVAQNFMGFYINRNNKTLYLERYDIHNYKDKDMFDSWWRKELSNEVNVIIFDK